MLDEMPVLKSSKTSRVLTAHPTVIEALPLINSHVSFRPFVQYLREKRSSVSETKERLYNYIIKKFESEPKLLDSVDDIGLVDENADLMELLTTSLFPVVVIDCKIISLWPLLTSSRFFITVMILEDYFSIKTSNTFCFRMIYQPKN